MKKLQKHWLANITQRVRVWLMPLIRTDLALLDKMDEMNNKIDAIMKAMLIEQTEDSALIEPEEDADIFDFEEQEIKNIATIAREKMLMTDEILREEMKQAGFGERYVNKILGEKSEED